MIYHILSGEEDRVIMQARTGDIIFCPSIASYNTVVRMLVESRNSEMIYVRLDGWKYFPQVGVERDLELGPEEQSRLLSLCREYILLVDMMRGRYYEDGDEHMRMGVERIVLQDELIRMTGLTDRRKMYSYCKSVIKKSGG